MQSATSIVASDSNTTSDEDDEPTSWEEELAEMTWRSDDPLPPYAESTVDEYDEVMTALAQTGSRNPLIVDATIRPVTTIAQYRYEPRHTGIAPDGTTAFQGYYELVWKSVRLNNDTYGASKSSPVVTHDGLVWVGTDKSSLVGVNRTTGEVVTELWLDKPYAKKGIHGTPSFSRSDDRMFSHPLIFIGDYTGRLYAFNRKTGLKHWKVRIGGSLGSSPVPYEGLVLIGVELNFKERYNGDGFLTVVDSRSGVTIWNSPHIGGHPHATPTIDPLTHYAYLGGNSGKFACFDLSPLICGRTQTLRTAALMSDNAMESACTVAAAQNDLSVYGQHNTSNPSQWKLRTVWEFQMGGHPLPSNYSDERETGFDLPSEYENEIKSTAALHPLRSIVYTNSWDFRVYALNALTGAEIWNFLADGRFMGSVSVDPTRELAVVGGMDGQVYGLDALTGALRWSVETEENIRSSATLLIEDGFALIGSGDSKIYIIDLDTGAVKDVLEFESAVTGVPMAIGEELFVFDHLGVLSAFKAVSDDDEDD